MTNATAEKIEEIIETQEDPESKELVTIEGIQAPIAFKMGGFDEFLAAVREKITITPPDLTTDKGRKAIASQAYKVRQIKARVDDLGKKAGEDARKTLDAVNAERKRAKECLEDFEEEIRKPLTDWEQAEATRKEALVKAIAKLEATGSYAAMHWQTLDLAQMKTGYDEILVDNTDFQEYAEQAKAAKDKCLKDIEAAIAKRESWDAEQAELIRLRAEKEERDRLDRERRIAEEAAAMAKREAEEKAHREATVEAARVKAEQEKIARERAEIDAKAKADAERAEQERLRIERERQEAEDRAKKAEEDRIAAEKKAQEDVEAARIQAENDAKAAAEQAERDKEAAIQAERDRVTAEAKRLADEQAKREADEAHTTEIQKQIFVTLSKILSGDSHLVTDEAIAGADAIMKHLVSGAIPYVNIQY